MTGTLYAIDGSVHDQLQQEGAAEISGDVAAAVLLVAANINAIIQLGESIGDDLSSIPDSIAAAAASASAAALAKTQAETAAAGAIGIDTAAQAAALAAQAQSNLAQGYAAEAAATSEGVSQSVEQVTDGVEDATAAAALAERWANEAPNVEVTAGKFGAPHFIAQHEALLATAPVLNFREFGTHAGEAGTNGVVQTFDLLESDLGRGIAINRLADRPAKLHLPNGLYNGPPAGDADLSMVPVVLTNLGLDECEIEGPAAGSLVLKPTVIAEGAAVDSDTAINAPGMTLHVILNIPAGPNRKFVAIAGVIYGETQAGSPTLTCASVTGITSRGNVGDGLYSGGTPIKAVEWTGDVPGTAAIASADFACAFPANWDTAFIAVKVLQNVSGMEDYAVTLRAGASTTSTQAFDPSLADSTIVAWAMQQGGGANPMTLTPNDSVEANRTGVRSLRDLSYVMAVDRDRPASSQTYTATAGNSVASPAVIGGLVFLPVTESTAGSDLIWDGTPPALLQPGDTAVVWALSDGQRYLLDMD